ncbi:RNA polymerase sigma factor SigV [Barrientosiimonas marina]|uniref:RNA polymerase sigma factor n=1 Tax=Lentibacillus kimchii TaxID=1542911 RepID=A0ABW2UU08_9BACI
MKKNKSADTVITFIIDNKEKFYRLAFSYVKNVDDALDIVQDSIEKAIRKKNSLKENQSVNSWFYKIVVNSALDFLRKNKRVTLIDDETIENLFPGKYDVYSDIDLRKRLDELPIKFRSVIVLKFFEDLKIDDVADILNENKNTIKTRLYKALDLLHIQMDDFTD